MRKLNVYAAESLRKLDVNFKFQQDSVKIPQCGNLIFHVVKGDWILGMTVWKGWSRVGAWTGELGSPEGCLWRFEPDRGSDFSSVRLRICVPSHM